MWTSIISYKRDINRSKFILSGFILLNIGCTLAGIIDLCNVFFFSFFSFFYSFFLGIIGNYDEYLSKSKAYETIVVVNGLSLLILCVGMLIYGFILKIRLDLSLNDLLLRGSHLILENNTKRIYLLRRILIILGICTTCFLLRVICLGLVLYDVIGHHHLTDTVPSVVWYTLSQWIPNFGAAYTLLFILKTRIENRTRIPNVPTTQRQFQRSLSNTSFRPSTTNDENNDSERLESKVSNISPIFITNKSDDLSHGESASSCVGPAIRNTIHERYNKWSGDWVPPNDLFPELREELSSSNHTSSL